MASNSDEKFFEDLYLRNNSPSGNAISNSNITYEFCWLVFDKYDKIYRAELDLPEYVVMKNVFKCIDPSILFPNSEKIRNFKRKVTRVLIQWENFMF